MTMARQKQKRWSLRSAQAGEFEREEQKAWPPTSAASGISLHLLHLPAIQAPGPHPPAAPVLLRSPGDSGDREVVNH